MPRQSRSRTWRPVWMLALLPLALPFLVGSCSGTDASADSASAGSTTTNTIEGGDLTGFDVKVHQAVG